MASERNFDSNDAIANGLEAEGYPKICANSVTNYLKRHGVRSRVAAEKPALDERAKRLRVEYSLSNLWYSSEVWRKTVFIDEFSIDSRYKRKKRVKRKAGERYEVNNLDTYDLRRPESVSFICCFAYTKVGPIMKIQGRSNAEKYLEFIMSSVIPFAQSEFGSDFYLLHDNAPIHTATLVQNFMRDFLPNRVHLHPPYSPDLNPIENLGSLLKKTIREMLKVRDLSLEDIFRSAWLIVGDNTEMLHKLVDSMQRRYQLVIDKHGNATRY